MVDFYILIFFVIIIVIMIIVAAYFSHKYKLLLSKLQPQLRTIVLVSKESVNVIRAAIQDYALILPNNEAFVWHDQTSLKEYLFPQGDAGTYLLFVIFEENNVLKPLFKWDEVKNLSSILQIVETYKVALEAYSKEIAKKFNEYMTKGNDVLLNTAKMLNAVFEKLKQNTEYLNTIMNTVLQLSSGMITPEEIRAYLQYKSQEAEKEEKG